MSEPHLDTVPSGDASPDPVRRLLMDQRERWQQGDRALVEAYCEREQLLKENPDALLDLIYNEVCLREETECEPLLSCLDHANTPATP